MYSDYRKSTSSGEERVRLVQDVKVPAKLVRECSGFSFDIGGSVMKLVYRTEADLEKAQKLTDANASSTVHLTSFSRQELDDSIEFIRENAHISRVPGKTTDVFVTGIGGAQFQEKMEKALDVKINVLGEGECFNHAFKYLLKNVPMEDLVHAFDEKSATKIVNEAIATFGPMIDAVRLGVVQMKMPKVETKNITADFLLGGLINELTPTGDAKKPMVDDQDTTPVALAVCGSAFGVILIDPNGDSYESLDMTNRGGRSCLALSSLFLGCKDFPEFLSLAMKGNSDNVDYCMKDVARDSQSIKSEGDPAPSTEESGEKQGDTMYDAFTTDNDDGANQLLICFGKGVGKSKDDFKREDMAATLLRYFCSDVAQFADKTMCESGREGVKHLFFAGSFPANDLARALIAKELTNRFVYRGATRGPAKDDKSYQFHFLKHGAHLGCLGSLINEVDPIVMAPMEQVAES